MEVLVERVAIPAGSTIGYGMGQTRDGLQVVFAGDWRPMRDLGEALARSTEPIPVEVPDESIVAMGIVLGLDGRNDESNGA